MLVLLAASIAAAASESMLQTQLFAAPARASAYKKIQVLLEKIHLVSILTRRNNRNLIQGITLIIESRLTIPDNILMIVLLLTQIC